MQTYSTVELARFVEEGVLSRLTEVRRESVGVVVTTAVFELYTGITSTSYGDQITAGFFSKILSDLRKTGLVETYDNGKSFRLSDVRWKKQQEYDEQRILFESLVAKFDAVSRVDLNNVLYKKNIPLKEVPDRYLSQAIGCANTLLEQASKTSAVSK
jgi:hypothetical protein